MIFVIQNSGNPGHVMVINKIHEMFSPVKTPLLGPVLTLEGMSNFKHIHRVKAGVNAFITFIIGAAVEHVVVDDPIIVSEQNLPDQNKIAFQVLCIRPETAHEIRIQAVSHIQAESVDIKGVYPIFYTFQQIICDRGILQVQLDQFKVSFPAFIP